MSRVWDMPNAETFAIPAVMDVLRRWVPVDGVVVDPFARNSTWGTITNDLDPGTTAQHHMPAEEFVWTLAPRSADCVLFDPPYSPRQISEAYRGVGLDATKEDTQNARLYARVRSGLDAALKPGGVCISFGWNSSGMGLTRGYDLMEVVLIAHGGAHNDTIVVVETKGGAL